MENDGRRDPPGKRKVTSQLDEGIAAAHAGDQARARAVFGRIIHSSPEDEEAWLWLAWVADTKAVSLRYLEEAQAFLPDSERIAEALRWTRQALGEEGAGEPGDVEGSERAGSATAHSENRANRERTVARVSEAAHTARQGASEALGQLKSKVRSMHALEAPWKRVRRMMVPLLSLLTTVVACYLVLLGLSSLSNRARAVALPDLPPPVADVTATPSVKQRTEPLWVQVDVAFTKRDWEGATDALERIRAIDPRSEEARQRLAEACYGRGLSLIGMNKLEEARAEFDEAIRLDAANEDLQKARVLLKTYLTGVEAYWAKDWPRVVDNLQKVYGANPNFKDASAMLAQAHHELGVEKQGKKDWNGAMTAFETALKIMPEMTAAQGHMDEVRKAITPPRRIEVDLSKQILTLFEDDQPVKVFTVCTGRPSAPTVPDRYEVQSKMPMAYASKWDINMPWWLGIYYAGGSENGFHGLPLLQDGRTIWADRLGHPCSYGCIVQNTEDALFVYNWADIGTVVFIRP